MSGSTGTMFEPGEVIVVSADTVRLVRVELAVLARHEKHHVLGLRHGEALRWFDATIDKGRFEWLGLNWLIIGSKPGDASAEVAEYLDCRSVLEASGAGNTATLSVTAHSNRARLLVDCIFGGPLRTAGELGAIVSLYDSGQLDREGMSADVTRALPKSDWRAQPIRGWVIRMIVPATITGLSEDGAYVDVPDLEGVGDRRGFVPLSELAWHRVENPADVVAVGDAVELQLLAIDDEHDLLVLSLRNMLDAPR